MLPILLPLVAALHGVPETIAIADRRELFVDSYLIEHMDGVALELHQPAERETVIRFDAPWEGRYVGYVTVLQDGDRVRMYYRGMPEAGSDGSSGEQTCYAESTDGIHFEKPNLGIYEVNGTKENNAILADMPPFSHNFAPDIDARPGAPVDERYKAMAGTSKTGLVAFVSPDGLHWRRLSEDPAITQGAFDSQNVWFWSEHEQKYLCYFRTWSETQFGGFRGISRSTSDDFRAWSDPVEMEYGGTPREHLYTNQTLPYFRAPHLYIAIAARFMPGRTVITEAEAADLGIQGSYWKDISDNVLMTSRGGNQYERTFMEGFGRPGIGISNWTSRTNYPARGIIETGVGEMSIYIQHNYAQPTAHLVRYTLRTDGFASVNAPYAGGEFMTKPLRFTGSALYLNYGTSAAGGLRVEVQDADGTPLPGFGLEACTEIIGNEIDRAVRWNESTDLSSLAGKPVRLRFMMKDADLYALQFR